MWYETAFQCYVLEQIHCCITLAKAAQLCIYVCVQFLSMYLCVLI